MTVLQSRDRVGLVILTLAIASAASVALVAARCWWSHTLAYGNLVWNLVLAWLPLGLASAAERCGLARGRFWVCSLLWLLFLPNSPYLITDLVHLKPRGSVPLWFDVLLVQAFVLTGLLLGFLSLFLMHRLMSRTCGWKRGWVFTIVILCLTGFGIYLGRFERWNSWDLFVRPLALMGGIWDLIRHPLTNRTAFGFSTLCAGFLMLTYAAFYGVTALQASPRAHESEGRSATAA